MTSKQRGRRAGLVVVLTSVVAFLLTAPPAAAQDTGGGGWSVDPGGGTAGGARSAFVYTLRPGQVFQDTVAVTNTTAASKTFRIYATDAFNTPIDAGFALLLGEDEPVDVGTWVTTAVNEITVDPNTRAEIPFQVAIPLDASPGDHVGGIVAEDVEVSPASDQGDVGVQIRRRVAARLYVRVDGPLTPELQVVRIDVDDEHALLPPLTGRGSAMITYEIRNTGNVRLTPTADLRVTGFLGRTVVDWDTRQIPELLPGSSVILSESFTTLPALEHLSARVTVHAQQDIASEFVSFDGSTGFWSVSWGVVVLLALAVALGVVARRNRRRQHASPEPPTPPAPVKELVDA